VRERTGGALPGIVPSNTYACGDGQSLVIAGNGDAIFKRLMLAIGRSDLANDANLARNDGRVLRTAEIDEAIGAWTKTCTADEALRRLAEAEVPASRIYSVADMRDDPQFLAREMFESHLLADGSPITLPGIVPKLSETPGQTRWVGPSLGEHTDEVLATLGYSTQDRAALRAEGVI
jgi:formyl-CoA transferase